MSVHVSSEDDATSWRSGRSRDTCTRQEYKRACAPIYEPDVPGWNTEAYLHALPEKLASVPYPERAAYFASLLECPEMRICHARSDRHEGPNTTDKLHKDTIDRLLGSLRAYKKMAETPIPPDPRLEETLRRLDGEAERLRVVDSRSNSRSTTPTQSPRASERRSSQNVIDRLWDAYESESESGNSGNSGNSEKRSLRPVPPPSDRSSAVPRPFVGSKLQTQSVDLPLPRPPPQPRSKMGRPPPAPRAARREGEN